MKKILAFALVITVFLSACGHIKADVADTPEAKATQVLVQQYIKANMMYDADLLMSLYADNVVWMDYGLYDGPFNKATIDFYTRESFGRKDMKAKMKSYIVTEDGRFAVLQTTFSMQAASNNKWASTPAIAILEFKDGKIANETWYYNRAVFY
jgi:ketosteroid isomerase-like protein